MCECVFRVLDTQNKDHHCGIKSPKMFILEWKKIGENQKMPQWCMQLQEKPGQHQSLPKLLLNWHSCNVQTGKGPEEDYLQMSLMQFDKTHHEKVRCPWCCYSWVGHFLQLFVHSVVLFIQYLKNKLFNGFLCLFFLEKLVLNVLPNNYGKRSSSIQKKSSGDPNEIGKYFGLLKTEY